MRKEKIKDLYNRIFDSADVIEFKNAMQRLETEAKNMAAETMPSIPLDKDGKPLDLDGAAESAK